MMKIKVRTVKSIIIGLLLVVCILFNSSYAYVLVSDALSLVSLFLISLCCGIYAITHIQSLKQKQILSQPFFYLSISVLFLMLFHLDFQSWGSYLHIVLVLIVSIYLTANIKYSVFIKWVIGIMTFMTCVSIVAWLYVNVLGQKLPFPIINGSSNGYYSSYYNAVIVFMNTHYTQKVMGAFWEPGIFAAVSVLSLILLEDVHCSRKKYKLTQAILILGLLLSFSTTGYFCFGFYTIYLVVNKIKNRRKVVTLASILFVITLIVVIFWNNIIHLLTIVSPSVFSKLTYENASLTTRRVGPLVDLYIMSNNYLIGVGMSQYNNLWPELAKLMLVESRTSTITFYLANFGVFGGLYLAQIFKAAFYKKRNMISSIILFTIIVIIVSTEPNYFNIFTTMFILYFSNNSQVSQL